MLPITHQHDRFCGNRAALRVRCRATKFVVKRRACASGPSVMMSSAVTMRSRLTEIFFHGCSKPGIRKLDTEKPTRPAFGFAPRQWHLHPQISPPEPVAAPGHGNRRRVVVGFNFHQNMRRFLMEIVAARFVVSKVATHFRTFHYGGVIFISRERGLAWFRRCF